MDIRSSTCYQLHIDYALYGNTHTVAAANFWPASIGECREQLATLSAHVEAEGFHIVRATIAAPDGTTIDLNDEMQLAHAA